MSTDSLLIFIDVPLHTGVAGKALWFPTGSMAGMRPVDLSFPGCILLPHCPQGALGTYEPERKLARCDAPLLDDLGTH